VTQSCARKLNETRLELSAAAELVNETASRSISSLSFQLDEQKKTVEKFQNECNETKLLLISTQETLSKANNI